MSATYRNIIHEKRIASHGGIHPIVKPIRKKIQETLVGQCLISGGGSI